MITEVKSFNIAGEDIDRTDGLLHAHPFQQVPSFREQWGQAGWDIETTVPIETPDYSPQDLIDLGYVGVILSRCSTPKPNSGNIPALDTEAIPIEKQPTSFSILAQIDAIDVGN